jgi:hypothetical protein
MYRIDPDGQLTGQPPIIAYCNFEDGSTELVEKCGSQDCFQSMITYEAPMSQLETLKDLSGNCEQAIIYECQLAVLRDGSVNVAHWIDNKGLFLFSCICLIFFHGCTLIDFVIIFRRTTKSGPWK